MGEMLTFEDSKVIAVNWHGSSNAQHPDENFARELFQLFTIGLIQLNMDGTPKLDPDGHTISTYTIDDIVTFSMDG